MTDPKQAPTEQWTRTQAIILALICLTVGIGGGWIMRELQSPLATGSAKAASVSAPAANGVSSAPQMSGAAQLKEMADAKAAPLLGNLKSDPNNPDLLTSIGNLYYDAQQYPIAVDYYQRVLKFKPSDTNVRTDMATAYWYMGNADSAIAEFNKALTYAPNSPNTLFNLGVVKWQGKKDAAGAIADWEKLLAANPNYDGKEKVEQMMSEAKKQAAVNPGTQSK